MATTVQPGVSAQWMQRPTAGPGVPPGLEYLSQVDQLLIKQQIELLEAFTGWESKNKYKVMNVVGQQVYFAAEDSDACMRYCCQASREFEMHIMDNAGKEVMRLHRPLKCVDTCIGGCCGCNTQEILVEAPPGNVVGKVLQDFACCKPYFTVYDAMDTPVLAISGPMCMCTGCGCDIEFPIQTVAGDDVVGKITRQWSGFLKEAFTDADNFSVTFPIDLAVECKATLLGALFLIDFTYFESKNNNS